MGAAIAVHTAAWRIIQKQVQRASAFHSHLWQLHVGRKRAHTGPGCALGSPSMDIRCKRTLC